ncbi:MAG: hypothetical protein R2838_01720 [Caldilineaceae bacterium]
MDGNAHPFPELAYEDYPRNPDGQGGRGTGNNGIGVVGIAHGCALMPVRFPLAAAVTFSSTSLPRLGPRLM